MAIWYGDGFGNSTTATSSTGYSSIWYDGTSTATTGATDSTWGWAPYPRVVHKKVYVEHPKHWTAEDSAAFVKLVNQETNTGWKVTASIMGDIIIHDPYTDVRWMADFVPLLGANASTYDRKAIDDFFEARGLAKKPKQKKKPGPKPKPKSKK